MQKFNGRVSVHKTPIEQKYQEIHLDCWTVHYCKTTLIQFAPFPENITQD